MTQRFMFGAHPTAPARKIRAGRGSGIHTHTRRARDLATMN